MKAMNEAAGFFVFGLIVFAIAVANLDEYSPVHAFLIIGGGFMGYALLFSFVGSIEAFRKTKGKGQ